MDEAAEAARRCAETMYGRDHAAHHLGIEITGVAPGRATARMAVTGTMVNGFGIAHGGYVFLLADTAFAYACNTHDAVTVAAAADVVFVAPAHEGDVLEATAAERTRYGRNGVCDVTVRRAADGAVVAEFRGGSRSRSERVLSPPGGSPAGGAP
ncbi:hydroxyphenylacetyl-CoA thioesterase PaaI [Actinomadura hibisca]|uniref:hydroxyphenylacetyl-CoA thioesterase PaaI n=1 Tax=Actinomadura hibisca TaxID=68565 RepID=UPI000833164F|nr:hydroxyphenylacetyl-CoA thioesterase PaaI [Actinomadura hibisca]